MSVPICRSTPVTVSPLSRLRPVSAGASGSAGDERGGGRGVRGVRERNTSAASITLVNRREGEQVSDSPPHPNFCYAKLGHFIGVLLERAFFLVCRRWRRKH